MIKEIQVISRPVRHSLGAEELVELGRATPVPMYRYAHMPFLANRPQMGRQEVLQAVNLLQPPPRDLFQGQAMGQGPAPVSAPKSGLEQALKIGIPVAGAAVVLFMLSRG